MSRSSLDPSATGPVLQNHPDGSTDRARHPNDLIPPPMTRPDRSCCWRCRTLTLSVVLMPPTAAERSWRASLRLTTGRYGPSTFRRSMCIAPDLRVPQVCADSGKACRSMDGTGEITWTTKGYRRQSRLRQHRAWTVEPRWLFRCATIRFRHPNLTTHTMRDGPWTLVCSLLSVHSAGSDDDSVARIGRGGRVRSNRTTVTVDAAPQVVTALLARCSYQGVGRGPSEVRLQEHHHTGLSRMHGRECSHGVLPRRRGGQTCTSVEERFF